MHKLSLSAATLMVLALSGCNDGDNPNNEAAAAPVIKTGSFKDSSVAGLTYVSVGQSITTGITGSNGSFTYEDGSIVTFSIGGVTLGSAMGEDIVTPINLINNSSSESPQVQNMVRFLVMLDADADPSNGIQISTAVRTLADNWGPVNFTSIDLATDLASIISNVASVNPITPVLLSKPAARAHIESTLQCINAGVYRGTYTGDDQGTLGLIISSNPNGVDGTIYSTISKNSIALTSSSNVTPDYIRAFTSINSTSGHNYIGGFDADNTVSGRWTNSIFGDTGSFSGTRIGGAGTAAYRFSSQYTGSDTGLYSFDIDNSGNVSGAAYSVINNEQVTLSGTLTGTALTVTTANNVTITATLDTSAGTIASGVWSGNGNSGTFTGSGCSLN